MPCTQDTYVVSADAGSTLRKWQVMIKMKFVRCPTKNALTTIASPHDYFDITRYNTFSLPEATLANVIAININFGFFENKKKNLSSLHLPKICSQ